MTIIIISWLPVQFTCIGWPFLTECSCWPALVVLFWLSYPSCPVSAVMFWPSWTLSWSVRLTSPFLSISSLLEFFLVSGLSEEYAFAIKRKSPSSMTNCHQIFHLMFVKFYEETIVLMKRSYLQIYSFSFLRWLIQAY